MYVYIGQRVGVQQPLVFGGPFALERAATPLAGDCLETHRCQPTNHFAWSLLFSVGGRATHGRASVSSHPLNSPVPLVKVLALEP